MCDSCNSTAGQFVGHPSPFVRSPVAPELVSTSEPKPAFVRQDGLEIKGLRVPALEERMVTLERQVASLIAQHMPLTPPRFRIVKPGGHTHDGYDYCNDSTCLRCHDHDEGVFHTQHCGLVRSAVRNNCCAVDIEAQTCIKHGDLAGLPMTMFDRHSDIKFRTVEDV